MGESKHSYAEMLEIKKKAEARLFSIPGVTAVAFGAKVAAGKPAGEFSIIVYITKKKEKGEVRAEEMVPLEIDGVKTDVVEAPNHIVRHASLQGGDKITMVDNDSPGEGTLGCFARSAGVGDAASPDILLSCRHVLFSLDDKTNTEFGKIGDDVTIPSCCDICHPTIAKVLASPPINDSLDAAIARLEPGQKCVARIHGVPVTGVLDLTASNLPQSVQDALRNQNYKVFQYGEKSGLTKGRVIAVDFNTNLSTLPNMHQLRILPIGRDTFLQDGDSGSVLYNEQNQIVGLNWGGDDPATHTPPVASFACEIHLVLNAFQVMPGGAIRIATNPPVVIYTVPGIRKPPPILQQLHRDLAEMGRGAHYLQLYGKHQEEVRQLLDHRRPLISAWHRNEGPAMARMLKDLIENRIDRLSTEFGGHRWAERVQRIAGALLLCGSESLQLDILRYTPFVSSLGGHSYSEMLELMRAVAVTDD